MAARIMREAGAALDRTPWLTRWRGSGRGSSPVASSTTSAVTRSIPRSSARRSARPHIRLIICGMPSDAAAIRSTASGAKGWAPPLTVRQRKSRYPRTPSASSGARRQRTDSRIAAPPSRSASSFASSEGLAHQQDPEIGAHDEERIERDEQVARQGLRLVEAHDDAASGFGGSQAVPQVVEAQRETLDHRLPSRARRARPRAGAAAWSCRCPAGR